MVFIVCGQNRKKKSIIMIKNTLSYLLYGSHNILPSSYTKLRSYLNTHSAILAELHHYKVFKDTKQCPYCFTSWINNENSFKLLSTKKLKSRESIENSVGEKLRNALVIKCSVCKRRSTVALVKKKYVQEKPKTLNKIGKKKKRKKDKLCGLLVDLKSTNESTPSVSLNKEKKVSTVAGSKTEKTSMKNQSKTTLSAKNESKPKNNNKNQLMLNPYFAQKQNTKKLKKLKNAIKQNDSAVRKTLKDFLSPV